MNDILHPLPDDPFTLCETFYSDKPAILITFYQSSITISKVRKDKKQYTFDIYHVQPESDYQVKKLMGFIMVHLVQLYKDYSYGNTK